MEEHLFENQSLDAAYSDNQFAVLATARSTFHLVTLKATFITNKQTRILLFFYVLRYWSTSA